MVLVFLFAMLLWLEFAAFYLSRWLRPFYHPLRSFGSGWLIAILFAEVLPLLFIDASPHIEWRFLSISFLFGFLLYHGLEKHTYQHARGPERRKEINYLHTLGFWADNFIKGMLLFLFFYLQPPDTLPYLLFGALAISTASNALNFRHFHDHHLRLPSVLVAFVSVALPLGTAFGFVVLSTLSHLYLTLALVSGAFTYFVIRDEIPKGKEGKPLFFALGVLFFILLFLYLR